MRTASHLKNTSMHYRATQPQPQHRSAKHGSNSGICETDTTDMSSNTVIIVGKGLTAHELTDWVAKYPKAQVWRLNDDLRYSQRCDRMFQLHDRSDTPTASTWARVVHPSKPREAMSISEVRAIDMTIIHNEASRHMANTICYMMAYAYIERFTRIVFVGCDFQCDRAERETELPHVMWWMCFLSMQGFTFDGPQAQAMFQTASYPPTQQP